MLSQCVCYTSEIDQILSPVLFQQSLYFPFLIHRIFYLLVSAIFIHALQYSFKPELCSAQKMAIYIIGASLSEPHLGPYSGCGLCHIIMVMMVVYRTSCPMRMREAYVESSKVSRGKVSRRGNTRGIVALLNRPNIGRCVQCDKELRIEHGTL